MEKLLDLLKDLKPDVDFDAEKSLIDDGILDSFDIVQLIQKLNEIFDVEISPADIVPENFNSADSIWNMIQKLQ